MCLRSFYLDCKNYTAKLSNFQLKILRTCIFEYTLKLVYMIIYKHIQIRPTQLDFVIR